MVVHCKFIIVVDLLHCNPYVSLAGIFERFFKKCALCCRAFLASPIPCAVGLIKSELLQVVTELWFDRGQYYRV